MKSLSVLLCTLVICHVICEEESLQSVIVNTDLGGLAGMRIKPSYGLNGTLTDTFDVFRGIPYALPPVGKLRFKPPESIKPWQGIRDATKHGPVCPQTQIWIESEWPEDEDCLYLSVYAPYQANSPNQTYPVIMYIHGGSYEVGTERLYSGDALSLQGVVIVMINYRLGILGFLTSGDDIIKGNYGILDQIQALRWIQENIHYFRGDPNKVTIMGQSVGSSSVGLLLTSPLSRGMYHSAIMQSGAVLARYSYQTYNSTNITSHFIQVGKAHRCTSTDVLAITDCLKKLPWKQLIYNRHQLPRNDPVIPEFRPLIDGHVLPMKPEDYFRRKDSYRVPILQGVVKDEMSPYTFWNKPIVTTSINHGTNRWRILDPVKQSIFNYIEDLVGPKLLNLVEITYSKWTPEDGYILQLSKIIEDIDFVVPTIQLSELIGDSYPVYQYYFGAAENSYHLVDLNYIFGSPFSRRNYDDGYGQSNYNSSDRCLSKSIMELWANFAKTGKAFTDKQRFPTYKPATKFYIHIEMDCKIYVNSNLKAQIVDFWTKIIPDLTDLMSAKKSHQGKSCLYRHGIDGSSTPCRRHATATVILGLLCSFLIAVCIGMFAVVCYRRKIPLQRQRPVLGETV